MVAQAKDERNYHVFYQLLGGVAEDPSLQKALALGEAEDYLFLSQAEGEQALRIEGVDDEAEFAETWGSMELLRMSPEEQMGSFKVIAAVLHLGNVEFEAAPNDMGVEACRIKYGDPLRKAAALLGVFPEQKSQDREDHMERRRLSFAHCNAGPPGQPGVVCVGFGFFATAKAESAPDVAGRR